MKHIVLPVLLLCIFLAGGWYFYQQSLFSSSYNGLPTVPCQDDTKPVVESFQFSLSIFIKGQKVPVPSTLGHDNGNCLHDIFVMDSSGIFHVAANEQITFTLGEVFDEWHAAFSKQQLFDQIAEEGHKIRVLVNGKAVSTYRETPLVPGDSIQIIYQ